MTPRQLQQYLPDGNPDMCARRGDRRSSATAHSSQNRVPQPQEANGAARDTTATHHLGAEDLIKIVNALPVGIEVRDDQGAVVHANNAGLAHKRRSEDDSAGAGLRFDAFRMPIDTHTYAVTVSHDVAEQQRRESDLYKRAYYDVLTDLPNRALLEQRVNALIDGTDSQFALAFIDLDGFKQVNDYYGHTVGDALLVEIAKRLGAEVRQTDLLARVGGDEFVLCMSPMERKQDVSKIIRRCIERFKEPFLLDGNQVFTSASIGVSFHPTDGKSFRELSQNADAAMYRVKAKTKGRFQFYSSRGGETSGASMKAEQDLRRALNNNQMCCAYQPKVNFRSGGVSGVEVLLRWHDTGGKVHSLGDFNRTAASLGIMDEITHHLLTESFAAVHQINDAFGDQATISINVAARQADEPGFMRALLDKIDATGIAPRFMLELTEEAFISTGRFQTQILPMIREIGAKVSIDDFGTGYSSLSALADITVDEIKVDRSFISAIHKRRRNQGILKAIESLAAALNIDIVVEGVETADELLYLQAATGIQVAQGFYLARPMFLDDLTRKMRETWLDDPTCVDARFHFLPRQTGT